MLNTFFVKAFPEKAREIAEEFIQSLKNDDAENTSKILVEVAEALKLDWPFQMFIFEK